MAKRRTTKKRKPYHRKGQPMRKGSCGCTRHRIKFCNTPKGVRFVGKC